METKLLRHLCSSHGVGKVLLVCERDATSVAAVDDALGGRLGAMEVVLPQRPVLHRAASRNYSKWNETGCVDRRNTAAA
jgi:hypothetical protein